MKFAIIWSCFFLFLSESKINCRQLFLCTTLNYSILKFICASPLELDYPLMDDFNSCSSDFVQPEYNCPAYNRKNFTLFQYYQNNLRTGTLDISNLGIEFVKWNGSSIVSEKVTVFNASHNQLSSMPTSVLMINLIKIDLSHNNFTTIDFNTFMDVTKLKEIYLNHNQLTSVPNVDLLYFYCKWNLSFNFKQDSKR